MANICLANFCSSHLPLAEESSSYLQSQTPTFSLAQNTIEASIVWQFGASYSYGISYVQLIFLLLICPKLIWLFEQPKNLER